MASEVLSLLVTSALLLVPYNLYFFLVEKVPDSVNKVWFSVYFVGFLFFRIRQELTINKRRANQRVFVDFALLDDKRRIPLDSFWTLYDLERLLLALDKGKALNVYGYHGRGEDQRVLTAVGRVLFDSARKNWFLELEEEEEQRVRKMAQNAASLSG